MKNRPAMRVTITEQHVVKNPPPWIHSAAINKYSDGTVILNIVKNTGPGVQGHYKGYKTVASAKIVYLRDYQNPKRDKCEKPEWKKVK